MASLTIQLRVDPATGKKDVIIDYHSDADALPMEHEADHRRLVEQLIAGGVVNAEDVGRVIVEQVAEPPVSAEEPQAEPVPERQK